MSKRILVTGGAGFIGSHVIRLLLEGGHEVSVVDNLSMGQRANVPDQARFYLAGIEDTEAMLRIIREDRIEQVCHLAARVSIRASTTDFCEDAETNVMGTLSLLSAITRSNVETIVFASSMAVYSDRPAPDPIAEEAECNPISPYGISKLVGERYIENIAGLAGRRYSILRLFNTYGSGQTFTPYVGVITIFGTKLLQGLSPHIFGDGKQIRDFVYVGDVAKAFTLALERQGRSGVYNIGSGVPKSVNEVATLLQKRINPDIPLIWVDPCAGEISNSLADVTRAAQELGYRPEGRLAEKVDEVIETIAARLEIRRQAATA